jgi:hypothetical protein
MSYNIGVNVIEVDGSATPAIVGAAVSVAAFNIATQRGAAAGPALVTKYAQFEATFGSYLPDALGAYLVKGFFDNGGQFAWVNRVTAPDATPSRAPLSDGAGNATLTLQTGYRGHVDPGSWGSTLAVEIKPSSSFSTTVAEVSPASITGTALAASTNLSAFPTLAVTVDGEQISITFRAADFADPTAATPAEIRNAINRHTALLTASLAANNALVLTSNGTVAHLNGTFTSLQVTAGGTSIGLAAGGEVTGTPATMTQTGTTLARVDGLRAGSTVELSDGTNEARVKLIRVTPATGAVEWQPAVANIGSFTATAVTAKTIEFDLTVARGGTQDSDVVERWTALTMESDLPSYAPARLNDPLAGSSYLFAINEHSASAPGSNLPAAQSFAYLTPGTNGTLTVPAFIGDQGAKTGFFAFDPIEVDLVVCERDDPAVVAAGVAYCQDRGDCMYVGSVPQGSVANGSAIAYGKNLQASKVYGALYGPWIKVLDPIGTGTGAGATPTRWIPPTGHIIGTYARIANARGVWKAPAGDEANLLGALDVEVNLSDADHTTLVETASVNGIRAIAGTGIVIDASRTLSTDPRWLYVNVRLLFNFVKSSLRQGLRWTRQEPNKDTLWDAVKFGSVTPFLTGLWRQGAFGTGQPADVFTVICDATNNPPDQVQLGVLTVEVYFYPSRPAETIVIKVGQRPGASSATEA